MQANQEQIEFVQPAAPGVDGRHEQGRARRDHRRRQDERRRRQGAAELPGRAVAGGRSTSFRAGKGEKDPVQVEYLAGVVQQTGEDWTNVKLILSTAQPMLNAAPPDLRILRSRHAKDDIVGESRRRSAGVPGAQRLQQGFQGNSGSADRPAQPLSRKAQTSSRNCEKAIEELRRERPRTLTTRRRAKKAASSSTTPPRWSRPTRSLSLDEGRTSSTAQARAPAAKGQSVTYHLQAS